MGPHGDQPPPAPAPGPLVRVAGPGDLPAVEALLSEIMAEHGVPPPPPDELRATIASILSRRPPWLSGPAEQPHVHAQPQPSPADRDHVFLLVEHLGSVAGMCALHFSLSTWSAAVVCELQDVIVAAPHRGMGLGKALLEAAAAVARTRGCVRLYLTAEAFNLPAHGFYRSLGLSEKTVLYFEQSV